MTVGHLRACAGVKVKPSGHSQGNRMKCPLHTGLERLCAWSFWRGLQIQCIGCLPRGRILLVSAPRPSHFLFARAKEKVTKEKARPIIRPRLRRGSLAPAPLRGHVAKGRPCPFATRSASCLASPSATPALGLLNGSRFRAA
ncbi:hypothetical protein AvCA_21020 [Azotobacter vinelandii CA]|uniref:Uncharacterized protein n=2 Tax=Azotobacter vinelandii TaxID=354 RepID=C1DFA0_AZOVD|nr:hypothetical protein Avin_21020 [Azotobacter vinelandii DJ]AGK15061.1 hypothetical protein AvCA_21020 [Azotobacter vinelandii CA]AGK20397.1 hypothetical protein AvCA6_21020 [Azotobacter vinelandii CA6]